MAANGLRGFPSLLLELNGKLQKLDISPWLGQPTAFAGHLQALLQGAVGSDAADGAFCTPQGCQ
jgi:putative protein-disulfide isomerase